MVLQTLKLKEEVFSGAEIALEFYQISRSINVRRIKLIGLTFIVGSVILLLRIYVRTPTACMIITPKQYVLCWIVFFWKISFFSITGHAVGSPLLSIPAVLYDISLLIWTTYSQLHSHQKSIE